ncbi:MAG: CHAP domain-containing protein [Clostridiales bacterium]|nr:CHAP domain-containing protein [Clostridiales bacterium]
MQNLVNTYLEKFKQERHVRRRLTCLLLALAMVVSTGVYWQLHLTGAALTNEVYCGMEEHTHTDECYEAVLVCTQEESEGHTHTEDCYETVTTLVCGLEESEGHTHTEECYDADGNLICGLEEIEGHTHTDECYETEQVLVCEQEESEGHTHTEDCYETQLVCTKEEHTHTIDCMVDETADVETADVWEATLPELTGVWADDVVAIATSQLGYTESTANFTLDEDGVTRRGYTRYGAWAGNKYGDWDAMFASFCLYYAGISTEEFPEATGAYAWSVTLQGLGLYDSADETPQPGDLVFFDADEDGKIDRVGIVTAVAGDGALTVIEGNYAEGAADAVSQTKYAAGSAAVVGYGLLPGSDEAASEDESEVEAEESSEVEAEEEAEESAVEAEESAVEPEESAVEAEAEEEADESAAEAEVSVTSMLGSTLLGATNEGFEKLDSDYYQISFTDVTYSNGTVGAQLNLSLEGMSSENYSAMFGTYGFNYIYWLDMYSYVETTTGKTPAYVLNDDGTYSTDIAYWYEAKYDEDSGKYYVLFYFNDEVITEDSDFDSVYFYINGTINSDSWKEADDGSGKIVISVDGEEYTYTPKTGDNESTKADISVEKTSSGYNAEDNTITYTVTVSSDKGTDSQAITLADVISLSNSSIWLEVSTAMEVKITKYNEDGSKDTTDTDYPQTIQDYKYASDKELDLTLNALAEGQYYVITYTVIIASSSLNISASAANTVSVSIDDTTTTGNKLTDVSNSTTYIMDSYLSKSGKVSSSSTITWTITVNGSSGDIAGYTLTDTMLSSVTAGDITITSSSSSPAESDYTITTDGNGNVTGITFNGTTSDDDSDDTNNTNTYTITYTTTSSQTLAGDDDVTNTAKIDNGKGSSQEVGTTVDAYNGSVAKAFTDSADNGDSTSTLNWTSTITIPAGGIANGTTIMDYVGSGSSDYMSGTSTTHQWYTYDQITTLLGDYYSKGITFTLADGSTKTINSGYAIEVYCPGSDWINYDGLANYSSSNFTAWRIVFNSAVDFGGQTATLTLNYATTADTTVVDSDNTSYTYTNNVAAIYSDGQVTLTMPATATYTENYVVVKTNGDGKTGETTISTSNNELTWIVKVYIPADSDYDSITVTDTLPEGVKLSSISVSTNNGYNYTALTYDGSTVSGTNINSGTVTDTSDGQKVELVIDDDYYSSLTTSGGYVYVKYVCTITDDVWDALKAGTSKSVSFANQASVTIGSKTSTSNTQTQTVSYLSDAVSKGYYWSNSLDRLTYYVLLNPGEDDLLADGDELTFRDTLYSSVYGGWGIHANLINSSVKFYTLTKLNGTWTKVEVEDNAASGIYIASGTFTYTNDEGTEVSVDYTAGSSSEIYVTALDASIYSWTDADVAAATVYLKTAVDIAWTYDEQTSGTAVDHIITATVKDETAYLVEYAYQITYVAASDFETANLANISNTATLTGSSGDTVDNNGEDIYSEGTSGGGASYRNRFVLAKVDAENYSKVLSGAVFSLCACKYDDGTGTWSFVDTGITLTTDDDGQFYFYMTSDGTTLYNASGNYDFTYNTAYCLVEKSAPAGYAVDTSKIYYFYWKNSDTTTYQEAYPDNWSSLTTYNLSDASQYVMVSNSTAPTTSITVEKEWVDENGTATTAGADSVAFQLWRYTDTSSSGGSSSGNKVNIYLNTTSDGWTASNYEHYDEVEYGTTVTVALDFASGAANKYYWICLGGYNYYDTTNVTTVAQYGSWTSEAISVSYDVVATDDLYIYVYPASSYSISVPTATGTLTLTKEFVNAPSDLAKDNVTFTVTDSDGKEYEVKYSDITTSGGSYTLTIPTGIYTITESGADVDGYGRTTTWNGNEGSSYVGSMTTSGETVAVVNTYTAGGTTSSDPAGAEQYGDTIYVTSEDGWSKTITGLPVTDSDGNTYYYYVKEVSVSGWTTTYSNNDGIETGTITITNQSTGTTPQTYNLPSAGGVGVWPYALAGLALCGGAVWLLRRRWQAED